MPAIASVKEPLRVGSKKRVRVNSKSFSGEAKQKYNDNYDRIFGGSNVRKKKNG